MHKQLLMLAALVVLGGCAGSGSRSEARVAVTENGFEPATVVVARGSTATLVITRRTDATCATEAVFAETGKKYALPLNQDVRIPIATDRQGTLHYACGMDMYKGQVEVK